MSATGIASPRISKRDPLACIDLDNAVKETATFERVVYTLGAPTNPKGT